MELEKDVIPLDKLPFYVDDKQAETWRGAVQICPGLYEMVPGWKVCFVVLTEKAGEIFSDEALAFGIEEGGAVFFPSHDGECGDHIIRYEIQRYLTLHGYPVLEWDPIKIISLFGAEEEPDYFGTPAPPLHTPHGHMTRYIQMGLGIFFIETDRFEQMLALSNPVWSAELTPTALALAELTEDDKKRGLDQSTEYIFFSRTMCAVPLYELILDNMHPELEPFIISKNALIASIWKYNPEYAVIANAREQAGFGTRNLFYQIYKSVGIDIPALEQPPQNLIPYKPDEQECEFLKLPDSWRLNRGMERQVNR